jgi:hypothetical protein
MEDLSPKRVGEKTNNIINESLKTDESGPSLPAQSHRRKIQSSWRSIENERPGRNKVVLVCYKSNFDDSLIRALAYRIYSSGRWHWSTDLVYEEPNGYDRDDIEVTHWMPLPEPPLKQASDIH